MKAKQLIIIASCLILFTDCENEVSISSNEANILSFRINSYLNVAEIDEELQIIKIEVGSNVNLDLITPQISISEGATINPKSNETIDLTKETHYEVTAADGGKKFIV